MYAIRSYYELMLSSQNLNDDATFANFDEDIFPATGNVDNEGHSQREHIIRIKNRAVHWCETFPNTNKVQTLFIGATGVGKSFLSNCIAHEIIKKGYSVVNSTASGINEAMFKTINEKDNSLIEIFKSCDLVITSYSIHYTKLYDMFFICQPIFNYII